MYIERIYTGCLAEAAYYIESDGLAAVIDPMQEPQAYLKLAAERRSSASSQSLKNLLTFPCGLSTIVTAENKKVKGSLQC